MFELIRPGTKIDFVGKRHFFLAVSGCAILLTFILLFTKGLNYGIDFTGGAEVQIQVPATWDIGKVRSAMEEGGIKGLKVVQIGEPSAHQFLVKAQGDDKSLNAVSGQVEAALLKSLKAGEYEVQRSDVVGPAAGGSLRLNGFLAMFYALLSILVYVAIRFDYRYAPGAVIALFHDAVITMGVFIFTQKQFDLQILAAILAVIGFSNNDTIIVFDRIRETVKMHPELSIEETVNRAVNDTLGRTLLTSLTTFITVFSLFVLGGKVIENFAFTLMVGVVVGTYSSIFIASSLVIMLTRYNERRLAKSKAHGGGTKRQYTVRPEPKLQG
jgi:preprotein translocase subunit SecF